ncbi:hypothetical protein COHA_007576 [Chlorella ohadii]|uniref:Uncharacterized protein n=1 Tax=Chlorella ohadii TaxID=2649997 RepID=A0AAD5DMW4_9CHLO|nr:hypothetical protein COHA_007576 [Chlorella ohadii]
MRYNTWGYDHSAFSTSFSWTFERDASGMPIYPTPEDCCRWCRSSWDCVYWEHRTFTGSVEANCYFYNKPAPVNLTAHDYANEYAKVRTGTLGYATLVRAPPPPPEDGSYSDPGVPREGTYSMLASDTCSVCGSTMKGDLGCRALYGAPRVQPLNDYRLIFFVKKCMDAYIAKHRVMAACGDDRRLYSSPLIKFSKACTQLVSGRAWYLSVRVGYPCFGTPRRVNGKIVGYPAWGRYRVHNLYCNIWQKAPIGGVAQPYDVNEFYRF